MQSTVLQLSCVHGAGLGTVREQSLLLVAAATLHASRQLPSDGVACGNTPHLPTIHHAPAMSSILRDWAVTGKVVLGGNSLASPDAPPSSKGATRSSSAVDCGGWKEGRW